MEPLRRLRRGVGGGGKGEAKRAKEGGDGEVSDVSLEMRHFQVFTHQEERESSLPGPLESVGMEK